MPQMKMSIDMEQLLEWDPRRAPPLQKGMLIFDQVLHQCQCRHHRLGKLIAMFEDSGGNQWARIYPAISIYWCTRVVVAPTKEGPAQGAWRWLWPPAGPE